MKTSIFDQIPIPPSAKHLGFKIIDEDPAQGTISIHFEARPEFLNPAGVVQGGYIAAMLDETMGPALVSMTQGAYFPSTIDMNIAYLSPAKLGSFTGHGRVVKCGKTIAFLEAYLEDDTGVTVARATAGARLFKRR